jgi:hypothetical protein
MPERRIENIGTAANNPDKSVSNYLLAPNKIYDLLLLATAAFKHRRPLEG